MAEEPHGSRVILHSTSCNLQAALQQLSLLLCKGKFLTYNFYIWEI